MSSNLDAEAAELGVCIEDVHAFLEKAKGGDK